MTFALILFSLLVLTGVIWLLDRFMLRSRRPAGVSEPWWVEYAKSFFPVILIVFVLRSFLVEPFKIPSGSMIPTLHVGDFILVNRYTYGLRLPIINKKFIEINQMTVKIRTIDTAKLSFVINCNPASAAHTRAVNHYRVKTNHCF